MAWDHLCQPKNQGGLGFKHLHDFNQAMLSKAVWHFLMDKDSLCVQAIKAKYRVGRNWLWEDPPKRASWPWKSINNAKSIILNGAYKLVSNGESICTWEDPWVPNLPNFKPVPKTTECTNSCLIVTHLLNPNGLRWDDEKLNTIFDKQSAKAIRSLPFRPGLIEDRWMVKSSIAKFLS